MGSEILFAKKKPLKQLKMKYKTFQKGRQNLVCGAEPSLDRVSEYQLPVFVKRA